MYKHPIRPQYKIKRPRLPRDESRDIEVLRLAAKGLTDKQIAERVGLHAVSVQRIVEKARELNRPWMSNEVEFLREHYMKSYVEWISKKLNRTVPDIEGKARELDLINQPPTTEVHLAPLPPLEDA